MSGTTKRLTERFAFTSGGKVQMDGNRPYIPDVVICGLASANGRTYDRAAWAGDRVKRYEGRPVYVDHADAREAGKKLGWFEQVHQRADGKPAGRLYLNPKHGLYESVVWAAEHQPDFYGMSHVAVCRTRRGADGRDVVEDIESVESVDLVGDPATTTGFFEHKGGRAVGKVSLKQFGERFGPKWGPAKWGAFAKVCEDMGAIGDMPVVDEPPADAETGDLKSALMAALEPLLEEAFDSGDSSKVVSALKDFIKLHAKHTGKAGPADGEGDAAAEEARRSAANLTREAIEVCRRVGFRGFDADDLDAIASVPAGRRESLAKRLMGTDAGTGGGEKPTSGGRHQFAEHTDEKAAAQKVAEGKGGGGGGGGGKADELPWLT